MIEGRSQFDENYDTFYPLCIFFKKSSLSNFLVKESEKLNPYHAGFAKQNKSNR